MSAHRTGVAEPESAPGAARGVTRRRMLGMLAGSAAAVGATGIAAQRLSATPEATAGAPDTIVPFIGAHQAGITTPAQDHLHFASFDVTTNDRERLITMLKAWSAAAGQMTQGSNIGGIDGAIPLNPSSPPADTGEALDLPAANLTITIGFGPTLFTTPDGRDRFALASRRPAALVDLPPFPGDALRPELTGGDIAIQACADDPQVAVHAIRNLTRIAFGTAAVRWSQLGFGRTTSTSSAQTTPRNLFGFKDGTANLGLEDSADLYEHVWASGGPGQEWMTGGSYLVARKIAMAIEIWDRQTLADQEGFVGRNKSSGAPLSGGDEFAAPDFTAPAADGSPVIATTSHVRLAHPTNNSGARLLRRGYNYVDGNDDLGRLRAGLFFLAYQRDPRTHFIPIQTSLAGRGNDALNEYVSHIGSAVFACPPGIRDGGWWGETLFA